MTSSPGEQKANVRPSLRIAAALLLPALAALWLWTTHYPPVREIRLFLFEDRQAAQMPWHSISESWTEANVLAHFQGYPVQCRADYTNTPGITRACAVDLKSLNGVETMYVNFLFANGHLMRVGSAVPWWAHRKGLDTLIAAYGQPHATQAKKHAGIRLHGWKLQGGGSVFYNRDRSNNPLEGNSIQWVSDSFCAPKACIQ